MPSSIRLPILPTLPRFKDEGALSQVPSMDPPKILFGNRSLPFGGGEVRRKSPSHQQPDAKFQTWNIGTTSLQPLRVRVGAGGLVAEEPFSTHSHSCTLYYVPGF